MKLRSGLRTALLAVVTALALLPGCSRAPRFAPGCYLNSAVPPRTRRAVESAADRFYALLRATSYDQAWTEGAAQLRSKVEKEQVSSAWSSIAEILTIPMQMTTEEVAVISIAEGSRGPQELKCADPADTTGGRRMVVTDQPLQAYLVQSGVSRGTRYNFASIWFFEEGRWKVASFGAQARELMGHDWNYYLDLARREKEEHRDRNAAILYNLAIDLLVPAPWIRPDMLTVLQREQKKLHPENLPNNRKERWVASDSTEFWPYRSGYEPVPGGLAVKFYYEVPVPIDSARVLRDAPKLAEFVRTTFPEYARVFQEVKVEAVTPVDHRPVWAGRFPLR